MEETGPYTDLGQRCVDPRYLRRSRSRLPINVFGSAEEGMHWSLQTVRILIFQLIVED